ncbi:MAG: hypothetical protein WD071_11250 [Pseudohongiella sp.]|uniref:hypothetical protein n=1 Tax=Pseudohongiella sp. TaxID=1979412 RepID=UPI0034A05614
MKPGSLWPTRPRLLAGSAFLLIAIVLSGILSHQNARISLGEYYQYRCSTGLASGPELRILSVIPTYAAEMAQKLCRSPAISEEFASVKVSWKPRTLLSTADLVNQRYDVIWNRHHFLTGLMPDFDEHYDTLLHYDNYSVFWLSLNNTPQMTAEYFQGKRIGLLADDSSHTHNLLPLTSLATIDTLGENYVPVYFANTGSLYDSFYRGELDLITGGLNLAIDRPVFRTLVDNSATAATFFVRQPLESPAQRCEIVAALRLLTQLWQGIETHQNINGVATHGSDAAGSCR